MRQLEKLEGRIPPHPVSRHERWTAVTTPLDWRRWAERLQRHPDGIFGRYIVAGLKEGFHIEFRYGSITCQSARTNMQSATLNPQVVDQYLEKEVSLGRVAGPMAVEESLGVQVNRFGVIEKPHQPGKFRLIVDLSFPEGHSVNDGIEPELCSMQYTSVDRAVDMVLGHERGALLAKFDIESAYRVVPVHPDDRPLLGMRWRDQLYVDKVLPFGLRSAPKIFSAVADALQWLVRQQGLEILHYLDDFLAVSPPGGAQRDDLGTALKLCEELGVPIAAHKTEGPSTVITFLGIEVDTVDRVLRLPQEKLQRLRREIERWKGRRCCTKRELQSIIGLLQHASCVVKPGMTFMRRMIALLPIAKKPHHRIRLNTGFRSDLIWWAIFLPRWNGTGMMDRVTRSGHVATITSKASGSWGGGAYTTEGEWFQLSWPPAWCDVHITVKELLPVVLAIAIWGHLWTGQVVRCRCDNAAVVAIVNSGSSKDEKAMHLMRSAAFFMAKHQLRVWAVHIPGVENQSADALSRNDHHSFLLQNPTARPSPSALPQELIQALVLQRPDWTSTNWTELFRACS